MIIKLEFVFCTSLKRVYMSIWTTFDVVNINDGGMTTRMRPNFDVGSIGPNISRDHQDQLKGTNYRFVLGVCFERRNLAFWKCD